MNSRTIAAAACLLSIWAAGCGPEYYKVTDPTTGRTYYTSNLNHQQSGSATLTDARTGNKVSLQNSEISKVSKQEFDVGRYAAPPAPAPQEKPAEPSPFK